MSGRARHRADIVPTYLSSAASISYHLRGVGGRRAATFVVEIEQSRSVILEESEAGEASW